VTREKPSPGDAWQQDPAIALALAYARKDARPVFEDLFALDRRLADAVRQASEPIIAQLKLAWWRDRFAQSPPDWPKGEPLLARLASWDADVSHLSALVDGWEALLAEGPLSEDTIAAFAEGRAKSWQVAARALGQDDPEVCDLVRDAGALWAVADLADHIGDADDRERAWLYSMKRQRFASPNLPRDLRPFAILARLAHRAIMDRRAMLGAKSDFLAAVRTGMLGL